MNRRGHPALCGSSVFGGIVSKGKGLWDTVKGSIMETVPDVHGAATSAPDAPAAPAPEAHPWVQAWTPTGTITVDPNAVAKIEARLQSATPPVYAAFMEQADALKDVIPDEGTRFKAAMKTSHATPDQIGSAIDSLLTVANGVLTEFNQSFEGKRSAALGGAQQQIDADRKLIETCEAQLKATQDQILALRTKVSTAEQQMQADGARLESVKQGFQAAHAQVVGRLNADKQRITTQTRIGS